MHVKPEAIIEAVKIRPILYDNSQRHKHDVRLRKQIWIHVCKDIFKNEWERFDDEERIEKIKEIQGKWSNLRTCFKRELNKQRSLSNRPTTSMKKTRPYMYYDELMFLLPFCDMEDKKNTSQKSINSEEMSEFQTSYPTIDSLCSLNVEKENPNKTTVKIEFEEFESENNSMNDEFHEMKGKYDIEPEVKIEFEEFKHEIDPMNGELNEMNENLMKTEEMKEKSIQNKIDDESKSDRYFLLSLLPHFENFTIDQKLDAEIKILNVLKNILSR